MSSNIPKIYEIFHREISTQTVVSNVTPLPTKSRETNKFPGMITVHVPQGLYLYGGVGCGKSFLMDLFYAEVAGVRKKRVHFNAFMLSVHQARASFQNAWFSKK